MIESKNKKSSPRRALILQSLAKLLEECPGDRVSISQLSASVGLAEGSLYRYFPKKSHMYHALIDFAEESIVGLFNSIRETKELDSLAKINMMIKVMLDFADVNRGICQVLTGHALMQEDAELRERINALYVKFNGLFRQAYREAIEEGKLPADFNVSARASLVISFVLGRWLTFVVSGYRERVNNVTPVALTPFFL